MIENDDDKDGETKSDDNDDNAYDLEAIIKYILIPKYVGYMQHLGIYIYKNVI